MLISDCAPSAKSNLKEFEFLGSKIYLQGDKLVSKDEIHKYGRAFHVNLLVKNKVGLKNLFQIISKANTKYLHKTPRILRSEIEKHREGLLVGSGCYESEVFIEAKSKSEEELTNIINFYDYVEVQPPEVYDHLLQLGDFKDKIELSFTLPNFVDVALGNKVYSQNPLYFKIYRRVKVSDSEETVPYELICSYFGYNATKTDGVSFTEEGLESDYVPGETVVFVDTHIERGVVYEYKVQSFADNTTREISSDTLCIAEAVGHTLAVASLKQNTYEQVLNEEGTAYCQIKVNFSY